MTLTAPADLAAPRAEPTRPDLDPVLRAGRIRLRFAWLRATGARYLPIAFAAAVVVALLAWVRPWSWPEPVAIAIAVGSLLLVFAGALLLRLPDTTVARAIDRGLETRDALATALDVDPTNPFAARVYDEARSIRVESVPAAIPYRAERLRWLCGAMLVVALVGAIALHNPQDDRRAELRSELATVETVAEQIEERAQEIADEAGDLDLAAELEALAAELRRDPTLEAAQLALEDEAVGLSERLDTDALSQRAAAEGLARTLSQSPIAAGETAAAQFAALSEALEGLTEAEQQALAERLQELAATQDAGDAATAGSLADAAAALSAGNVGGASSALSDASASAAGSADAAAAARATEAVADELRELRETLENGAAGQGAGEGQGQGAGEGQGQGAGEGQGQGAGEGQGQGAGEGQGQGAGEGSGQPSGAVQGGGSGTQGQGGQGSAVGNGVDDDRPGEETTTDAPALGGESDILDIAAIATGDDFTENPETNRPNTAGEVTVGARSVVDDFESRAVDAMERLALAPSEASTVESYFDALRESTGSGGG